MHKHIQHTVLLALITFASTASVLVASESHVIAPAIYAQAAQFTALSKQDQEFILKYELRDARIRAILDATFEDQPDVRTALRRSNSTIIKDDGRRNIVAVHPEVPHLVIKYSLMQGLWADRLFSRVIIAQMVRDCVQKHQLELVVPHKYLYHIPGRPFALNNKNWLVLAQKLSLIAANENKARVAHLSPELRAQLDVVRKRVGFFSDMHDGNIVFMTDGRLALVDFEMRRVIDLINRVPGLGKLAKRIARRVGKRKLERMYAQQEGNA